MLKSKYPIVAVSMNQVSDITFAIACSKVGITPSIGLIEYIKSDRRIDYVKLVDELIQFKNATGGMNLIFTTYGAYLHEDTLYKILKAAGIEILEIIFPWKPEDMEQGVENRLEKLSADFTTLQKLLMYDPLINNPNRNGYWLPFLSGAILKGERGAGHVADQTLDELFENIKCDFPDKKLIVSGGIYCKQQIDHYISNGASGVGIGTLFAVSKESKVSDATKKAMLSTNTFTHDAYAEKNAVVFKPLNSSDPNYTASLKLGLQRPDLGGHAYCGYAAKEINKIMTLKAIVKRLTS